MIEDYESGRAPAFVLYGLGLEHKHVPEIEAYSGLTARPLFSRLGRQFSTRHAGERSVAPGCVAGAAERRRSARGAGSGIIAAAAMSRVADEVETTAQPRLEPGR